VRTTREKGREVRSPVHPHRPSERLEVFSEGEKMLISRSEDCFTAYEEELAKYKDTQFVPISELHDFRQNLKVLINKCWEVVQQYTAPLTKRRTIAYTYISKKGKGTISFSRASWESLLEAIRDRGDYKDIIIFSPMEIERKSERIIFDPVDITQREKAVNGLLPAKELKEAAWSAQPEWVSYFSFFGVKNQRYKNIYNTLSVEDTDEDFHDPLDAGNNFGTFTG